MSKTRNQFTVASRIFWGVLGILCLLAILRLSAPFFRTEGVADLLTWWDIEQRRRATDTLPTPPLRDSMMTFTWRWKSAQTGRSFEMQFDLSKSGILSAVQNRSSIEWSSWAGVYGRLSRHDARVLEPMIKAYKQLALSQNLGYSEAMEMVVSSIQSIPYTWVLGPDQTCGESNTPPRSCSPKPYPFGCCDGIDFGVFSPVEFVTRRTGDCDTRSLLAYTILKRMEYDVAIMVSEDKRHSVLGVNVPGIPGDGRAGNVGDAKNYYLWELTSYGPELGRFVEGNDWWIAYK